MAAPLQLADVAHGEQKGWRRSQHLVDSLPYVDGLTPQEKAAVDKLIEEEVRAGPQMPLGSGPGAAARCRHCRRLRLLRSPCLVQPLPAAAASPAL